MELRIGADPVPILRHRGGTLRCRKPRTELEIRYLKFFEEFQIQYDETIPDSDEYDLRQLDVPQEVLPVTGEFIQSLCDYTVINKERSHPSIDEVIPRTRQLFIEEEWDISEPTSLFVYPEPGLLEATLKRREWPKLRLLVVHNGDNQTNYNVLIPFLNANPQVHAWLQNNTVTHPQIRSLPIGDQNRFWRGGNGSYEPTMRICRSADREHGILYPWCSATHPMRPIWYAQAKLLRDRTDLVVLPRLDKEDYLDALGASIAVVCPPGNGLDTHRHWESLYMGAWAIVHDNAHTYCLLHEYPSLPLIPVTGPMSLQGLAIKPAPSPFHPMLLRHYWEVMFRSYAVDQAPTHEKQ